MKKLMTLATLVVVAGWLVYFAFPFQTIYALCLSDLEIVFLVVDAETGKPISGATVSLREDFDQGPDVEPKITEKVVTGEDGRAAFLRKSVRSEDIIKPFQPTHRTFDLSWGAYSVSSQGYAAVDDLWLSAANASNREDLGITNGTHMFRLQFTISLLRISSGRAAP
jgi:hypothetical protein